MKFVAIATSIILIVGAYSFLQRLEDQDKNIFDINNINLNDQIELEEFWQALLNIPEFGYTLVGTKAVSFYEWDKTIYSPHINFHRIQPLYISKQREKWEKFSEKNPSKYFSLFFRDYKSDGLDCEEVILVNKIALEKYVTENKEIFEKSNLIGYAPEQLLTKILREERHDLIGILLGFGKENSECFQKSYDLRNYYFSEKFFPSVIDVSQEDIEYLSNFSHPDAPNTLFTANEFSEGVKKLRSENAFSLEEQQPLTRMGTPCFRKINEEESCQVIQNYKLEQKKIVELLHSDKFLEDVLQLYFEGPKNENK